jgi:hypothetical protein
MLLFLAAAWRGLSGEKQRRTGGDRHHIDEDINPLAGKLYPDPRNAPDDPDYDLNIDDKDATRAETEPETDTLTIVPSPRRQEDDSPLEIDAILPEYCGPTDECDIAVRFRPANARVGFCRFGGTVVRGSVKSDNRLHCKAPRHPAGQVNLSIGRDGEHFFGAVVFTFERRALISLWIIGAPALLVTSLVALAWLKKKRLPKRRRKKESALAPLIKHEGRAKHRRVKRRNPQAFV